MPLDAAASSIDGTDPLPAWLRAGCAADGTVIRALRPYTLHPSAVDQPALVIPLQGRKVITVERTVSTVGVGEYLMLHRSFKGSVRNDTQGSTYRAWCIDFPWRVVELVRMLLDAHALPPAPGPAFSTGLLAPLYDDLRRLVMLSHNGDAGMDAAARDHVLAGLLLALARSGQSQFRLAQDPALAARIRLLVRADPAREWCSAEVEARLHMSGATLRRHLAAESTSLRVLVREARLDHGLHQLQATRRPLKTVAQACGYRSVPSFCRQFAARFGVDAATVANGS